MQNALPDFSVSRFVADVSRLIAGQMESARFGIAVSGGPDSMALLSLAHAAWPGRVAAATVDHGLRSEAATEAAMVADWCAEQGIAHSILRPEHPITGNLQSRARTVRYALLHAWREAQGLDWLMTAHHADDQLETLLMRINRGSGVGGLSGIRARNNVVLRPLLSWRRDELAEVLTAASVPSVQDPSNTDARFDRVAMRQNLMHAQWLDPIAANRTAGALAEADAALDWFAAEIAAQHIAVQDGIRHLHKTDYPREILRRLLLLMLTSADPTAPTPRGHTLDRAIAAALAGERISIGQWVLDGKATGWHLTRAERR